MLSMYPACFYHENDGYSVIFPDLNWLATQGDTFEEAMEMAVDCLAGYLHTCQVDGDELPRPSKCSEIDAEAIARELDPDSPVCESFVNIVTVDVALYAKEHFEKAEQKAFHPTALRSKGNTAVLLVNIPRSRVDGFNNHVYKPKIPVLKVKKDGTIIVKTTGSKREGHTRSLAVAAHSATSNRSTRPCETGKKKRGDS